MSLFFCYQCGHVFTSTAMDDHQEHKTAELSKSDLNKPSKFLAPAENKKTNAVSMNLDAMEDFCFFLF